MHELVDEDLALARRLVSAECRRSGRWRLRDELESAAFEALVRAAQSFDAAKVTNGTFAEWAAFKVKRALVDAYRSWFGRDGRSKPEAAVFDITRDDDDPTYEHVEASVVAGFDLRLIDELGYRHRTVLLATIDGRPHGELAAEWGVTESRVSQLLAEARARLHLLAA